MMRITITIGILTLFLIAGCLQQPTAPAGPTPITEPEEQTQMCTEMWLCKDENTKAYRKLDCTFEQVTNCPAGCENGQCKEQIVEEKETTLEETKEQPKKETKQSCDIGWKCLDQNRKGYQSSNCMFSQVEQCKYGCKDGECIKTAPPEEEKEETFTLTEGKGTIDMPGWRFFDFSKGQSFQKEINDYDFKLKLYATTSGYDYFRAISYRTDLWTISKGIKESTREDCMKEILKSNTYEYLRTGQTLCINTKENNIALIGGYWEGLPKEDTELSWKYYS